jgi:hypothetical protein
MKATGRKGDTELIHMTKREVAGLQALAEAAGGTLTKNPKTGLPEASFLENLLPTIIGVGVGMFAGPMAGAAAGAAVGGAQNKDDPLMGALMGGLGGYGGAGIGAGLNTAGAASAQAAQGAAAQQAATQASQQAAAQGAQQLAAQQAAQQTAGLMSTGVDAGFVNAMRPDILAQTAPTAYQQAMIQSSPEVIGAGNRAAAAIYDTAARDFAAQPFMDRASQGIGALGNEGGRAAFMRDMGGLGGLAKTGAMAAAPMIVGGMMPRGGSSEAPAEEKDEEDLMGRYEYRANPTGGIRTPGSAFTGERVFFQPEYRRMFAAKGGEVKKFADGGEAAAPSSEAVADTDSFDPARGMTGMSRDAMMYLYGLSEGSRGNVPQAVTNYTAPEIRFNRGSAGAAPSGGGGMGGGIGGGFGGGFGGEGSIGTNPNANFGYFSGMTPNVNYGIPVVDRMDYTGMGGGAGGGFGFGGVSASDTGNLGFGGGSLGGFATDGSFGGGGSSMGGDANSPGGSPNEGGLGGFGGWKAGGPIYADGGIASLARGGMKAGGFVVPADVVSMVGEGNTDAGYERIKRMLPGATPIKGKDGGQADTVKTSIEGKQPARIAHGEMYVPPAAVKRAGGAKKLYAMMDKVRKQATGDKKQIKPVNLKKAMA